MFKYNFRKYNHVNSTGFKEFKINKMQISKQQINE